MRKHSVIYNENLSGRKKPALLPPAQPPASIQPDSPRQLVRVAEGGKVLVDQRIEVAGRGGLRSSKTAEAAANLAFVFGKIVADVGDLEGTEDRSVRLAFEQETKALFDEAFCICFAACEALDIARSGGNAVARRPSGGYFDFVNVAPLLHHAKGWLWKHATSIDTATKRENQIYRNRRRQTMVKASPSEEILLPSWIPSSKALPPEPEPFKFGRRPRATHQLYCRLIVKSLISASTGSDSGTSSIQGGFSNQDLKTRTKPVKHEQA